MWEEEGLHPAEVAEDAKNDAFLAHDLGSAATHPTDLPPLAPNQRPTVAGKIVSDLRELRDQAFDVGRWIEKVLTPIASSPDTAIRYAAEYLSKARRVQWEALNIDKHITENFTREQQEAIWRALDEESVMRQSGEKSENLGLATLAPDEQALAKELSAQAITTRLQMIDRGMVTDEGLPSYVPRVFRGIERGEHVSLGPASHIREKTGTMLRRKYLTADESEAAAKARFGPKAELVRNIRVLPQVLAKQQRAIAAHDFIEAVKEFGRAIGDPQIIEGDIPAGEAGKWFTVPDSDLFKWQVLPKQGEGTGPVKMVKKPLHIKKEWEGAIQAIGDTKFNNFDRFIVETKNRPMTLIMNSPFIHDSVVYSKALPSNPGNMLTFRFMRHGAQLLKDEKFMREMMDAGLVPWGKRAGFKQDVTGSPEMDAQFEPGRSLTARLLGYVPDLFSEKAGRKVKSAVDRAAEVWHDKLLGEQVQKLQVSLAYDFRETLRKKFPEIPVEVLNVLAAHEANRFGGSLPPEAMSAFSRGVTNAIFFSRQFTFGNLGILKDAVKGPPEYVMARVRDMLGAPHGYRVAFRKPDGEILVGKKGEAHLDLAERSGVDVLAGGADALEDGFVDAKGKFLTRDDMNKAKLPETGEELSSNGSDADELKNYMRRHAFTVVMLDVVMFYGVNALLQSGVNIVSGTPMADEVAGYWWRLRKAAARIHDHPLSPSSYLSFLPSLSPTFYHEPGKEGKILLGFRNDGTAIYARSVIGRMGEDYTGLVVNPAMFMLTKMAPMPRAFLEIVYNRDSFDRPIYDPKALKSGDVNAAIALAKHLIEAELPMQQVEGAGNLMSGEGDYKDAINTFGPYIPPPFTVTGSQGYPGGPEAGVVAGLRRDQKVAQDLAMSEIKRMVQKDNNIRGARQKMNGLGVNPRLQKVIIRGWLHPGIYQTSPRAIAEFYKHATPMEKEILEGMRMH
jgi:hypothetical protein